MGAVLLSSSTALFTNSPPVNTGPAIEENVVNMSITVLRIIDVWKSDVGQKYVDYLLPKYLVNILPSAFIITEK